MSKPNVSKQEDLFGHLATAIYSKLDPREIELLERYHRFNFSLADSHDELYSLIENHRGFNKGILEKV